MTKNTLDIIDALTKESQNLPDIIAPILGNKVVVMILGHPYRFRVVSPKDGWYILKPLSSIEAGIVRYAEYFEIMQFLKHLPKLSLIAMRRLTQSTWLVFPFNKADATQRGFKAEPQPCYLVSDNIRPFDRIMGGVFGDILLFDSLAPLQPEWYNLLDLVRNNLNKLLPLPKIATLTPELEVVYQILLNETVERQKRERLATVEGRIADAIEFLGAKLVGYSERGEGYEVNWKDDSGTHKAIIDANLRLVSAGICLSHLENRQTLASAVAVMRGHREHYDDWGD